MKPTVHLLQRSLKCLIVIASFSFHTAALAETPQADAPVLQEVVVTAKYEFLSVDTSGTTNLPLPIEQVPQSINLVSADFIQAADLKTLAEIAEYTPGAVNAGNQGNTGTSIKLRGFASGRAVDGINIIQGFSYYEPDYAIFDRLEVVQGPSSVVYGVSSPGGVVNFVTKSATAQTPSYVLLQGGSWSSFRLEGQGAGALDADGHVRAIGVIVRDQGDSFMDVMNHQKTSVYGGLDFDLPNSVSAYIHGGYERYVRKAFDGIPTEADGSPAPVPRSFFIGSKYITLTSDVYHTEGDLTWHATDMLEFSLKSNYEHTTTDGALAYSFGLTPEGDLGTEAFNVSYNDANYGIGLSSLYRLDGLGMKDSFVTVGVLYQNSRQPADASGPASPGTANIFDGVAALGQAFDELLAGPLFPSSSNTKAQTTTASTQALLHPVAPLAVLLGVSYSKPDVTVVNGDTSTDFSISGQVSYRAGLTYEFLPKTFAYVSYSQSFNPQVYQDINHNILPPLKGVQYEGGVKYRSSDGKMLLTGALFEIKEKNVAQYDQSFDGLDYFKAIGEVRHRGVELSSLGQITPQWQINAGYAFLDPRITGAVDSPVAPQTATIGQTELYIPKNTFSVYTTYTLPQGPLRGLTVGGGVRYVSSQSTSYDSALANEQEGLTATKDLPGYTLVDASLAYTTGKWLLQFNAHNIFNKYYFINNYQTLFYGNVIGEPANFALSVRRQF